MAPLDLCTEPDKEYRAGMVKPYVFWPALSGTMVLLGVMFVLFVVFAGTVLLLAGAR